MNKFLISLVFITFISVLYAKETQKTDEVLSCVVERGKRKECGTYSSDQDKCEKNGCCWKKELFVPWCFKPISIKTKIVEDRAEDEDNSEASSETGCGTRVFSGWITASLWRMWSSIKPSAASPRKKNGTSSAAIRKTGT